MARADACKQGSTPSIAKVDNGSLRKQVTFNDDGAPSPCNDLAASDLHQGAAKPKTPFGARFGGLSRLLACQCQSKKQIKHKKVKIETCESFGNDSPTHLCTALLNHEAPSPTRFVSSSASSQPSSYERESSGFDLSTKTVSSSNSPYLHKPSPLPADSGSLGLELKRRQRQFTIVDREHSNRFSIEWMNSVDRLLSFLNYGNANFYGCEVKLMWLAVDQDNLQLEHSSLYAKFQKEVLKAIFALLLGLVLFPFRFIVGVPFYAYVLMRASRTDIVARRAKRHLDFLIAFAPLYVGAWISILVVARAFSQDSNEFNQIGSDHVKAITFVTPNGILDYVTMYELSASFRAMIILVVIEVIRKQRRDMTYVVNIIRHHLLVDEARSGKKTEVSFGSAREDNGEGDGLWLLSKVFFENTETTLLGAHLRRCQLQLLQLQAGTGSISEIADVEAGMFLRSDMRDMLEQRIESLVETQELMNDMEEKSENLKKTTCESVNMDFNQLVQVLCAGYPRHFVEEISVMQDGSPSWYIVFISAIYASLPIIISAINDDGSLEKRISPKAVVEEPLGPLVTVLAAYACYMAMRITLTRIRLAVHDLSVAYEGFIILQRLASTHHLQAERSRTYRKAEERASDEIRNRFATLPGGSCASLFQKDESIHSSEFAGIVSAQGLGTRRRSISNLSEFDEECDGDAPPPDLSVPDREYRKRVRFHASVMRGADCHINVGYKYQFDIIMDKRYSVKSPLHCHSFVELNLHNQDQLRMWWTMRMYLESGLLKDKLITELLLGLASVIIIGLIVLLFTWYVVLNHAVHLQAGWDFVFVGFSILRVIKICAKLNRVLESDSKRLKFIEHDIQEHIMFQEQLRRQSTSENSDGCEGIVRSPSAGPLGLHPPSSAETPARVAVQKWSRYQALMSPTAQVEDRHFEHRATMQLLEIYASHLDRDHRPLQLFGITISRPFLQRVSLFMFTGVVSGTVHLLARSSARVQPQAA